MDKMSDKRSSNGELSCSSSDNSKMSQKNKNEMSQGGQIVDIKKGSTRTQHQQPVRKGSEWEILGSLDPGTKYPILPKRQEGYLSKRRKWPMKGWHKRYFILEKGILTYGKSQADIKRGRTHGRIDVGCAVISAKTEMLRIDIDDEECIHHIKLSNLETFGLWLENLKQHRLYQQFQNNLNNPGGSGLVGGIGSPDSDFNNAMSPRSSLNRGMRPPATTTTNQNQLGPEPAWATELTSMDENMTRQLLNIQQQAVNLALLAQKIEDEQNTALGGQFGSKSKKLFGLRKKKSGATQHKPLTPVNSESKTFEEGSHDIAAAGLQSGLHSNSSSSSTLVSMANLSNSNPNLSANNNNSSIGHNLNNMDKNVRHSINLTVARPISLQPQDLKTDKVSSTLPMPGASIPSSSSSSASSALPITSSIHLEEVLTLAQDIQTDVSNLMRSYSSDRDSLKKSLENSNLSMMNMNQNNPSSLDSIYLNKSATLGGNSGSSNLTLIASLRQSLHQTMQQNSVLRAKLQKINLESDLSDIPNIQAPMSGMDTLGRGHMNHSLSYSSSTCISEFFDAREYSNDNNSDTSDEEFESDSSPSESEDERFVEAADSNSPSGTLVTQSGHVIGGNIESGSLSQSDSSSVQLVELSKLTEFTGRRVKLPVPKSDAGGINLWNLLCKNIGKDLSKISMPVTLNEPLSALQRLCEELEYSELLDKASKPNLSDLERITWVAAFAVSVYGSCQARAGYKPFNPLLGETFECCRDDRGFRYLAEQVSHHPPVSACHAESLDGKWTWQQDLRVKTKFWGKSMEFQPEGEVCLTLKGGDKEEKFTWNKITTCIHNLFGGDESRYVDLYGQLVIKSKTLTCKIDFVKASYWSNKRHELYGTITDKNGKVLQHLFGKWSEALYIGRGPSAKCIWRPAMLPADSQIYYGFSRFAIELNELLETEKEILPQTDTRFRPDQRFLEEGQITEAESMKLKLELAQRNRRQRMEEEGETHKAKWFVKQGNSDKYEFNKHYWIRRNNPSFKAMRDELPQLW